eukprot:scaffold188449_cov19-Tisochrysis_lutea.AAC.2
MHLKVTTKPPEENQTKTWKPHIALLPCTLRLSSTGSFGCSPTKVQAQGVQVGELKHGVKQAAQLVIGHTVHRKYTTPAPKCRTSCGHNTLPVPISACHGQ